MNKPKINQSDLEKLDFSGVEEMKKKNFEFLQKLGNPLEDKPDPIEEVKKEWEDDDYIWEEDEFDIKLITKKPTYYLKIRIFKNSKTYQGIINFKEHIRLIKTFRALGWEV